MNVLPCYLIIIWERVLTCSPMLFKGYSGRGGFKLRSGFPCYLKIIWESVRVCSHVIQGLFGEGRISI